MQARQVRAGRGWQWLKEGFALLARAPMVLLPMTLLMLTTLLLLAALPIIGPALSLLAAPGLMFGFVQAVSEVAGGKRVSAFSVFAGFRAPPQAPNGIRGRMLGLGLFNLVASLLAALVAHLIDGGATGRLLQQDPRTLTELDASPLWAALAFVLVYGPAQVALWFAPLFAGWHGTPPGRSLFYSFVACWRNRGAFLVHGLGWAFAGIAASVLTQVLLLTLSGLAVFFVAPLMLVLVTALYVSIWPAYQDIFVEQPRVLSQDP